ncbi:hypothetical protein CJU90_5260 [Yarrowia sp. C11]|nr:hypothetical protein CJU90_5260 [Yarrowia sp. C11]KAG5365057.1 hypothetical protein CKK34_3888 [Yarrowia sp. E02]
MSFSFNYESIKKWNRAITALSRIGENLTWEVTTEGLNLSVMNASGLSHMTISFLPGFFSKFESGQRLTFRTANKGIFNISKRMEQDGSVKECHVTVLEDHTVSVQSECVNHIKRTYFLSYELLRSVPVIPDGHFTSSFALHSRRFREFVEHLKGEQVEIKWDALDEPEAGHENTHHAVSMKSVTAPIKNTRGRVIRQAVNTRLKISAGIFDDLSSHGGQVAMPMVDLRHFLNLSESLLGTILCQFGDENTPARFELVTESLNGPNEIECVLHFMNMTSAATLARSKRKVASRQLSSREESATPAKMRRYSSVMSSVAETVDDNVDEDQIYYDDTVLNYPDTTAVETTASTEEMGATTNEEMGATTNEEMDPTNHDLEEPAYETAEEEPLFLDDDMDEPEELVSEIGPTQTTRVTGILDF